jgi:hypothetical protein
MGRQSLAARLTPSTRLGTVVALVRLYISGRPQKRAAHRAGRSHAARARDDEAAGELRARMARRSFLPRTGTPGRTRGARARNGRRTGRFRAPFDREDRRGRYVLARGNDPELDRGTTMSIRKSRIVRTTSAWRRIARVAADSSEISSGRPKPDRLPHSASSRARKLSADESGNGTFATATFDVRDQGQN